MYRPFQKSYPKIYPRSPAPKKMLLLGAGMGAALEILQHEFGFLPLTTLVDSQAKIIQWSKSYSLFPNRKSVSWVISDAQEYIRKSQEKYDLIGVDLFMKLVPRDFIYEEDFIIELQKHSAPDAYVIINTIIHPDTDMASYLTLLNQHFRIHDMLSEGRNRYIILQNSK